MHVDETLTTNSPTEPPKAEPPKESNPFNRKMRRAQEAIQARQSQPDPNPSPSRLLHQRVSLVEQEQERLGKVLDSNSEAFSDSLKMLEAMTLVLQRVMNEMLAGDLAYVREDGSIDFKMYLRDYWLCMLMADFAAWCRTLQPEEKLIVAATENDVHVFGGD